MMKSVKEKIEAKIKASPRGKIFVISDFEKLGAYNSVRIALSELSKEGLLERVHLGIYQKPKYSELFRQNIPATPDEIARAIARKNNWKIAPAKDLALNLLGLDTQVPNRYDYISDGPTKTVQLEDGRALYFRHVTQRESLMAETSSLVIEALKQLGEENVTETVLRQIVSKLTDTQLKRLEKDAKNSRVWIKEKIKQMKEVA
ncbi:DUF6088 family protein [Lactococcus lactis]|uniref:DUF6088 family protein n=1 Tax=Lactococcus lactis TaxID=1358 RepID=UPI00117BAAD9|nr:DUF6088 family protein [Lactococcus lactis]TRW66647.1 type IV toxin-antitoxin system AbiEi family antitoxin domain-containing protein [Lactococcus lactis]